MTTWLIMGGAFLLGFFLVSKLLGSGNSEKTVPVKNSTEPEAVPSGKQANDSGNYVLFGELVLLISVAFNGNLPPWCKVLLEDFGQRKLGCSDDEMEGVFLHPVKNILKNMDGRELAAAIRNGNDLSAGLNIKIADLVQSIIETAKSSGSGTEAKILAEWLIELNKPESDISLQSV